MAPFEKLETTTPSSPATDREVLRAATARMRALGIDGEAVFSSSDPAELMAFLGVVRR